MLAGPSLFTIGYEGPAQRQLLEMLTAAGIRSLLDIRAVPQSRKAGFSKSVLAASLHARGIGYLHDRRLGTPKPGRDAARSGQAALMYAIFNDHMATRTAQDGLANAVALATTQPVCLLCFEREPHDCHRSIVAQLIHARTGQPIRHL